MNDSFIEKDEQNTQEKQKVLDFKRPDINYFYFKKNGRQLHEPRLQRRKLELSLTKHNKIRKFQNNFLNLYNLSRNIHFNNNISGFKCFCVVFIEASLMAQMVKDLPAMQVTQV